MFKNQVIYPSLTIFSSASWLKSLLVPNSAQNFAFITTFLAILVVGTLDVQKLNSAKKQLVYSKG